MADLELAEQPNIMIAPGTPSSTALIGEPSHSQTDYTFLSNTQVSQLQSQYPPDGSVSFGDSYMDQILGQVPAANVEAALPASSPVEELPPKDAHPDPSSLPQVSSPIVQDPNLSTIPESQPSPVVGAQLDVPQLGEKVAEDASCAYDGVDSMNGDLTETQAAPEAIEQAFDADVISVALEGNLAKEDEGSRAELADSEKAAESDQGASVVSAEPGPAKVQEEEPHQGAAIADEPVIASVQPKIPYEEVNPSLSLSLPIASYSHLESTTGPSSSTAVAENLLHSKSPGRKAFQSLPQSSEYTREVEPPSSADPDMSASQFGLGFRSMHDEMKEDSLLADSFDELDQDGLEDDDYAGDVSGDTLRGPTTSTQIGDAAPEPAPLPTQLAHLYQAPRDLTDKPTSPSKPIPKGFGQSSIIMKNIVPAPKPPRFDPMDRDWTQEEQAAVEELEGGSNDGSKAMSLDQTGLASSNVSIPQPSSEVPRPTAERTLDMDIVDEEEENSIVLDATLGESKSPESLDLLDGPSALRPVIETPLFGPEISTASYSQQQQQQFDTDNDSSNRRLSDIADLQSSMDELTQIDVAATQVHYDAEDYESGYVEDSELIPAHRLPAFAIQPLEEDSARQSLPAPPGRELRRIPPPPSDTVPSDSMTTASSPSVPLRLQHHVPASSPQSSPLRRIAATSTSTNTSALTSSPFVPVEDNYSSNERVPDSEASPEAATTGASESSSKRVLVNRGEQAGEKDGSDVDQMEVDDEVLDPEKVRDTDAQEKSGMEAKDSPVKQAEKGAKRQIKLPAKFADAPPKSTSIPQPKKSLGRPRKVAQAPTGGKGKGKGKARALENRDSPDELDLLRAVPDPMQADDEDFFQETNYEDLPLPTNATRRASRTSISSEGQSRLPSILIKGKRKAESPVSDPEVEKSSTSKRARIIPTKKGKALSSKATLAAATIANSGQAAGGKTRGRPPRVLPTPSPMPEGPIAGPSKIRFSSVDDVLMEDGMRSTEASYDARGPSRRNSRVPSTAPFTRILGLWRLDGNFYPGTIVGFVSGPRALKVIFDDESKGNLSWDEARRCELKQGDYVIYREEIETETQRESLADELRVYKAEKNLDGTDQVGELAPKDDIVVTKSEVALEDQEQVVNKVKIKVAEICILAKRSGQLDDRKLTEAEKDAIQGVAPLSQTALNVVTFAPAIPATSLTVNKKKGIFDKIGFLLTIAPPLKKSSKNGSEGTNLQSKESCLRLIESNGGTLLDLPNLFRVEMADATRQLSLDFPALPSSTLDTILLVADRPSTTPKFLISLALGIPCVSTEFLSVSSEKNTLPDWKTFAITAGYVQSLKTYAVGGQVKALTKPSLNWNSLESSYNAGGLFHGLSILAFVPKSKPTSDLLGIRSIIAAGGALRVDFVHELEAAKSVKGYQYVLGQKDGEAVKNYDYVLTEDSVYVDAFKGDDYAGVVNMEWVKQSLISGRLLPAAMLKPAECDH